MNNDPESQEWGKYVYKENCRNVRKPSSCGCLPLIIMKCYFRYRSTNLAVRFGSSLHLRWVQAPCYKSPAGSYGQSRPGRRGRPGGTHPAVHGVNRAESRGLLERIGGFIRWTFLPAHRTRASEAQRTKNAAPEASCGASYACTRCNSYTTVAARLRSVAGTRLALPPVTTLVWISSSHFLRVPAASARGREGRW